MLPVSPETFDFLQKGGVVLLLVIAVGALVSDRKRLLASLRDKDAIIAAKDAKLEALSERTITSMIEFKGLIQSVVDIFNQSKRR